jgi:hypothetical protein
LSFDNTTTTPLFLILTVILSYFWKKSLKSIEMPFHAPIIFTLKHRFLQFFVSDKLMVPGHVLRAVPHQIQKDIVAAKMQATKAGGVRGLAEGQPGRPAVFSGA